MTTDDDEKFAVIYIADHPLCLKPNSSITNDPCDLCGARCDPDGIDYFVKGTDRLVCDECAEKHCPQLYHYKRSGLQTRGPTGAET